MKKIIVIAGMFLLGIVFPIQQTNAQIEIINIIKAGIKKVITAVDLKIQRLQNKTIWLQNAQKTIENSMSELKLNDISDWVEKQRVLYKDYFDELSKVKNVISWYHRIKEITLKQTQMVEAYKKAFALFKQDNRFTAGEIDYMGKVYSGIMDESLKNLDQVFLIIHSFSLQISDAKRLELIDHAADAIDQNYNDVLQFNHQNIALSIQRSKNQSDIDGVRNLYGLH